MTMTRRACRSPRQSANTFQAISRPITKTIRQPPKKAISNRASTGGSFEKSHIRRNSIAGSATEKTNCDRLSDIAFGQPEHVAGRQLLVLALPLLLAEAVQVWRGDPGWILRLPRPVQALAAAALFLATVFLGASFPVRFLYFQF